jgi:hypothetical protein
VFDDDEKVKPPFEVRICSIMSGRYESMRTTTLLLFVSASSTGRHGWLGAAAHALSQHD